MTNFLNHYTLKYTPLSPIHIGTDDSYEPTNYVIDDGTLYEFDSGGAASGLSASDRTELSKIVSKPDAQMLKAVQKFFYERREALKPWAINAIPVLDGVARFYGNRVGQTANHESGGAVINNLEINRCAYNPINRQPVLFGSSIKGAIRTALLSHINNDKPLQQTTDRRTGRSRKENNLELQQRLLQFRAGKFELDPMRLVQIGDATWVERDNLPKAQICMTVNRKKHRVVDDHGNERLSQSETKQSLNKLLECVPAWRYRAFAAQLNLQVVNSIKSTASASKLPENKLCFSMEEIAKICSKFYLPKLKAEIELLRDRGFIDKNWDQNIQNLLSAMTDKIIKGNVFLLRVGRHSGAESVTLNGERVRNIKILEGKDPVTKKQNFSFDDKTKTLWLAAHSKDQRTDLLPFGWLLVEVEPINSALNECSVLAELCDSQHNEARLWADKQAQQKTSMEERRREADEHRKQDELKRHQQAEIAAQAEQARLAKEQADQQRLANLSPIEQDIETFLKPIQAQDHDTRLLQELEKGRWQNNDARVVAEKIKALMEQAGKWMPDFAGDNKQKVKLKQRSQKVLAYL